MTATGHVLYLVFLFGLGACIGSFLNVVIYRLPLGMSVNNPRWSFCPTCSHTLAWYDNIPLLAYLYLHGQCRYCGTAYGLRYPLVEGLTGLLYLLVGYRFGLSVATSIYLVLVSLLIVVAFIDLDHFIIPTDLVWVALGLGVITAGVGQFVPSWGARMLCPSLFDSVLGAISGYVLLWIVRFVGSLLAGKEAMGLGDLILIAMFGAFFGWQSLLLIVLLSSLVGSMVGLIIKYRKRLNSLAEIPYGPYLVIAAVIYLLAGQEIMETLWGDLGWLELWHVHIADVRPWRLP